MIVVLLTTERHEGGTGRKAGRLRCKNTSWFFRGLFYGRDSQKTWPQSGGISASDKAARDFWRSPEERIALWDGR